MELKNEKVTQYFSENLRFLTAWQKYIGNELEKSTEIGLVITNKAAVM